MASRCHYNPLLLLLLATVPLYKISNGGTSAARIQSMRSRAARTLNPKACIRNDLSDWRVIDVPRASAFLIRELYTGLYYLYGIIWLSLLGMRGFGHART